MKIASVDIGYSSVKIAHGPGEGRAPEMLHLPVGAAPASRCGVTLGGELAVGAGHRVMINGEPWVAGIDPAKLADFIQSMDEGYITTDEYRALFYAALSAIGETTIDVLVTGLPVAHFRDEVMKLGLEKMMSGRHYIRDDLVVEVNRVIVVPQPAGAFSAHMIDAQRGPDRFRVKHGRSVLVVDPGHYSLDWIMFLDAFRMDSSGSNARAGEAVVREAAAALSKSHGVKVRPARLQEAVLHNAGPLEIGRHSIDFWPAVRASAAEIVNASLRQIRGSVRQVMDERGVDLVLVAGGGADLFYEPLREAFSDAEVTRVANPMMANARGYYIYGMREAGSAAAA